MKKIGMIGVGNMGSAILRGVLDANYAKPAQLFVYDKNIKRMETLISELRGVNLCATAS